MPLNLCPAEIHGIRLMGSGPCLAARCQRVGITRWRWRIWTGRWRRALCFVPHPCWHWVPRARGAAAPCPCARAKQFRAGCSSAHGRIALALLAFLSGPLQEFRLRAVNPAPCASKSRKNRAERTSCLSCASWSVAAGARPARTFCIILHIASPVPLGTRALRACIRMHFLQVPCCSLG